MKVGMYYANNDVRVQEMPVPKIGPDELLIQIYASGICGSDVMEWYRKDRVPLILGHEIAGRIVDAGKKVRRYKIGQRISAAHHVPCNKCHFCKIGHQTACDMLRKTNFDPGGFAEYARIPAVNVKQGGVFLLPKNVSYEEGACIEPLACVLRGQRLAGMRPGKSALVLGSGITGILHIKLAKLTGASRIIATDVSEFRLKAAKKAGANLAINAKSYTHEVFRDINKGLLADLVIVSTGAEEAIKQAFASVERGGTILFFAPVNVTDIPVPFNKIFWRNEITLTSSYAASPEEHIKALKLIADKKINVRDIITHRLPLDKIDEGFRLVAEAGESLKVIIEMNK